MRKGGLVRIHDSILMAESKYKCLLISEHTTGESSFYCNVPLQIFSKKHEIWIFLHIPKHIEIKECIQGLKNRNLINI